MLNIGTGEVLVVLVVALLVLGPDRLPHALHQAGRAVAEVRRFSAGAEAKLHEAVRVEEASAPAVSPPVAPPADPPVEPGTPA